MTTTEQQPRDQSDRETLSPRERLFNLVDSLVVSEPEEKAVKSGFMPLAESSLHGTLLEEKIDIHKAFFSDPTTIQHATAFPNTMYRASIREEGGRLITSFSITSGDEDIMVTSVDDHGVHKETEVIDPAQIDVYLNDFFTRYGL